MSVFRIEIRYAVISLKKSMRHDPCIIDTQGMPHLVYVQIKFIISIIRVILIITIVHRLVVSSLKFEIKNIIRNK